MNKKIPIISILAVFMLLFISFASAIDTNNANPEKKESPLYHIRTKIATADKISNIFEKIKTKFIGERLFFMPFQRLKSAYDISYKNEPTQQKNMLTCQLDTECGGWTCFFSCFPRCKYDVNS